MSVANVFEVYKPRLRIWFVGAIVINVWTSTPLEGAIAICCWYDDDDVICVCCAFCCCCCHSNCSCL